MAIPVKLPVFEGPLDLLLHLIEKNKIDIYDIPIAEITDQYLAYIEALRKEDLNITSEFMVMAAELIEIKCRMLLPSDPEETEEEEDPRSELVRRLLEYKMYKYMSYELRERFDEENPVYRAPDIPPEVLRWRPKAEPEELLSDVSLEKLKSIFDDVVRRQTDKLDPVRSTFREVRTDEVNLNAKVSELAGYAKNHRHFSFRGLLKKQRGRMQTIVMFLAVLEFMKAGYITISQKALFEDIEIDTVEGTDFEKIAQEGDLLNEYNQDQGGA